MTAHAAWQAFLRESRAAIVSYRKVDELIADFAPVFASPYQRLPFRTVTASEALAVCGIADELTPNRTSHLYGEVMQRSLAGNSFHPRVIQGLLGTSAEVRQWLCSSGSTSWRPAAPSEVLQAWPSLLRKIRPALQQRSTTLPDNPFRPMSHPDILTSICAPCPSLCPSSLHFAAGHTAAQVRVVRQGYLDNCRGLLGAAYDALQGGQHLPLIDAFRFLKMDCVDLVELVPFLLRELSSWHPPLTASATSASLVEVCEFWAVHCTGQKTTGHASTFPGVCMLLHGDIAFAGQ